MSADTKSLRKYLIYKSSVNFFLSGINVLIALILLPIITKAVGQTGYGLLAILTTLSAQVNLVEFGFGAYITKKVSEWNNQTQKEEVNTFLSTSAFYMSSLMIISSLVIAIVLFFFFDKLFKVPAEYASQLSLSKILTVSIFCTTFISMFFSRILAGCHAFEFLRISNIISEVLRFLWIVLVMGPPSMVIHNLNWLMSIRLILNLILIFALFKGCQKWLVHPMKISFKYINKENNKLAFSFSAPLILGKLLSRTQSLGTVIISGITLGPAGAGVLLLGQRIFQTSADFAANFILTVFPMASRIKNESSSKIPLLYLNGTHYNVLLNTTLSAFVLILIHPVLFLFFEKEFSNVEMVIWCYLPTLIFGSFFSVGNEMLVGIAKHNKLTPFLVLMAITSIFSQYLGSKFFGPMGIAIGVSIASFVYMIGSISIHRKLISAKITSLLKILLKNSLLFLIIYFIGFYGFPLQTVSSLKSLIITFLFILVCTAPFIYFIGVLPKERELIIFFLKNHIFLLLQKGGSK